MKIDISVEEIKELYSYFVSEAVKGSNVKVDWPERRGEGFNMEDGICKDCVYYSGGEVEHCRLDVYGGGKIHKCNYYESRNG